MYTYTYFNEFSRKWVYFGPCHRYFYSNVIVWRTGRINYAVGKWENTIRSISSTDKGRSVPDTWLLETKNKIIGR